MVKLQFPKCKEYESVKNMLRTSYDVVVEWIGFVLIQMYTHLLVSYTVEINTERVNKRKVRAVHEMQEHESVTYL